MLLKYQHDLIFPPNNKPRCLYEFFMDGRPLVSSLSHFVGIFFLICVTPANRLGEAQESRQDEIKILFIFLRITELGAGQYLKGHLKKSPSCHLF